MLKQTITYKDWDDVEQTETLWFNITKDEVVGLRHLVPRFRALEAVTSGPEREMSMDEIAELLDMVKVLIDASYGERPDRVHFDKSPETLKRFKQTAAYSEFIFQLFEKPQVGIAFMQGVWPREMAEGLETANMQVVELPQPEIPAWILENRDPYHSEVSTMTREQLSEAMRRKMNAPQSTAID